MTGRDAPHRALVTGAAQGLGLAIATALLEAGSRRVVLADRNEDVLAVAVADLVERFGGDRVAGIATDVTDHRSVSAMTDEAVAFAGGLDALVTCAGVISRGRSEEHDWTLWERDLQVNVGGTYRCARAAFPALCRSEQASLVTVGSLGSFLGMPLRPSYNTSKAAVLGLTRTLAVEWGRRGIRVNAVAPGFIDTEMMRSGMTSGLLDEGRIIDRLPLGRLGHPQEIAEVVVFLASPRASYVSGAVVPVDGGLLVDGTFFAPGGGTGPTPVTT